MAAILRSKAPFHCRAAKVPGGKTLCLAVLAETDGDECSACAAKLAAARERFWNAPVRNEKPSTEAVLASIPSRQVWP